MFQSILLVLLIIGFFWGIAHYKRQPPAMRKKVLWKLIMAVTAVVLLLLVATGRLHWLIALVGAALPFARSLLGVGMQLLPLWLRRKQQPPHQHEQPPPPSPAAPAMAVQEALDILGLKGEPGRDITPDMVNDAHRRLIQKVHPDRGGSDYLAAQINRARDLLLSIVK